MIYRETDIEALKAPDVMHAYCAAALGAGKRFGNVWKYPCPFGAHTRLKLEVAERNGAGVAICRACNQGGTVFDIAAAVLGVDRRAEFAKCVQEVAEKTGAYLATDDAPRPRRKSARMLPPPPRMMDEPAPEYLPPDEERAALDMVRAAAAAPDAMMRHAAALGLPADAVMFHTDIADAAPFGLLGLDARGALVYVYTMKDDAGAVRVTMTKRRALPGETPRFLAHGRKCNLWGADAARNARRVVIAEGESDTLALRAAFWIWADIWAKDAPETYPAPGAFPVVLGKPDAGTFRETWARALRGKDAIIAADNDDAGRAGARATAAALLAAGACRVFIWHAPAPAKDARAALDAARPWLLAENVMNTKTLFEQ